MESQEYIDRFGLQRGFTTFNSLQTQPCGAVKEGVGQVGFAKQGKKEKF